MDDCIMENFFAVIAIFAVFRAVEQMRSELCQDASVFDNSGIKRLGVIGFEQLQHVAFIRTFEIRIQDLHRIAAGARGEFCHREIFLVQRDVLGADEIRVAQIIRLFCRIAQIIVADAPEFIGVVHRTDFGFVRHKIVVEIVRGTVIETTTVGEQKKFFAVHIAPAFQLEDSLTIAVVIAAHVETVEVIGKIIHPLNCADLHVNRCTDFKSLKIRLEKFCDQR